MSAPLDLEELLRKCHRAELLPLARSLGVNTQGLGLHQLARATSRTLRRRGANDLANLFLRGGEGPKYAQLLRELAGRLKVPVGADAEATERNLAEWWIASRWKEMSDAQRAELWSQLHLQPPAPPEGTVAVDRIQSAFSPARLGYVATTAAAGAGRFLPLGGFFFLYWLARPKDEQLVPAVLEVARLRQQVLHRITVGVVGSPSSGKDAALAAIFGLDRSNVNPVAGSTKEVEITRLPAATALFVVNTPGLGDVVERVTEEARQVLDHIDLYVYLVNAQGGVQARERSDYGLCRATGRPVLVVVNKIDTLKPADRERFLADCRTKLGISGDRELVGAAFDPLPQLAEAPIGIEVVRAWIRERLVALGKDAEELPWSA